jgi:hypothetical protein
MPTWPFGNAVVVMDKGPVADEEMVKVSIADAVWAGLLESVTVNVSGVALAGAVGVPVIAPVAAFRVRPAGKEPLEMDHV